MNDDSDLEIGKEDGEEVEVNAKVSSMTPVIQKDEVVEASEDGRDREAIRERRREERQTQKQRRREASAGKDHLIASLQRQNQEMAERLIRIESRQMGSDFDRVDRDLNQALQTANEAKEHLKNAATAADGEGVMAATDLYYKAMRRAEHLQAFKQNAQRPKPQAPQPADHMTVRQAGDWMQSNRWYNPDGDDEDSEIVRMIDNRIAKEGFDPRSQDYWDELTDRVKEKLPHRYEAERSAQPTRKSPVAGSGREGGGNEGRPRESGKYFLSAERVRALKESGMWDDPEKRAKMVKRYQDYDKGRE